MGCSQAKGVTSPRVPAARIPPSGTLLDMSPRGGTKSQVVAQEAAAAGMADPGLSCTVRLTAGSEKPSSEANIPKGRSVGAAEPVMGITTDFVTERTRDVTPQDGQPRTASSTIRHKKRKGTPWPGKGGHPLSACPTNPEATSSFFGASVFHHCCVTCQHDEADD
mmetsp:Transcript_15614/g.36497  ORF Transcript_15614/g.36497 Transcript_15614/m.36497 type:complete len:165 (+) Transcript_15614:53-547(+)